MANGKNSIADLKKYLTLPNEGISMQEFKEFWESCTEEEKEEFKNTELPREV